MKWQVQVGYAACVAVALSAISVCAILRREPKTAAAAVVAGVADDKPKQVKRDAKYLADLIRKARPDDGKISFPVLKIAYQATSGQLEVTPLAGAVHVRGQVKLTDFEEGAHYVWMVRFAVSEGLRPSEYGQPVYEEIYENQRFQAQPGVERSYDFDDLIQPNLPNCHHSLR